MFKNAWEEYKAKNGVTPLDAFNKNNYINQEDSDKRFSICLDCDKLLPITHQCKECGCFMKVKTKLKNTKCPLGKW